MSKNPDSRRWTRTVTVILATIAIAMAAPTAFAATAGAAAPAKPTCTTGATPVLYQQQWYCPATATGVKNTIYGTGKRVLLTGVSVTAIRGTTATVSSTTVTTTPCPPDKYCGAIVTITVTTISVSVAGLAVRPVVGSYGDLYGITGAGALTATGFVARDATGVCTNPAFC